MTVTDYPVDLRAQYPERSSRGWAVCTIIIVIKLLALLPHPATSAATTAAFNASSSAQVLFGT